MPEAFWFVVVAGGSGDVAGGDWPERRVDAAEFEVSRQLSQQAQQLCSVVLRQLAEQGRRPAAMQVSAVVMG